MEKEKTVKLDLEFVLNGAIISYEDGDKEVVQDDSKNDVFNYLGGILKAETIDLSTDNVSLEFKIKWKENESK